MTNSIRQILSERPFLSNYQGYTKTVTLHTLIYVRPKNVNQSLYIAHDSIGRMVRSVPNLSVLILKAVRYWDG